eukprot:gene12812-7164_t
MISEAVVNELKLILQLINMKLSLADEKTTEFLATRINKLLEENRSFQIGTIRITKEELSMHYIKNYETSRFNMEQIEKFCHKYVEAGELGDILQEDDTNEIKFNSSFVVTTNSTGKTITHLSKILLNQGTEFPSITLTLSFIDDDQSIAFGKMDCKDAFYLTALSEESRKYFDVSIGNRRLRWKVCVYGISGMPMHYKTNLNTILSQNPRTCKLINYMDDIIYSISSYEEALKKELLYLKFVTKIKSNYQNQKIAFMQHHQSFLES